MARTNRALHHRRQAKQKKRIADLQIVSFRFTCASFYHYQNDATDLFSILKTKLRKSNSLVWKGNMIVTESNTRYWLCYHHSAYIYNIITQTIPLRLSAFPNYALPYLKSIKARKFWQLKNTNIVTESLTGDKLNEFDIQTGLIVSSLEKTLYKCSHFLELDTGNFISMLGGSVNSHDKQTGKSTKRTFQNIVHMIKLQDGRVVIITDNKTYFTLFIYNKMFCFIKLYCLSQEIQHVVEIRPNVLLCNKSNSTLFTVNIETEVLSGYHTSEPLREILGMIVLKNDMVAVYCTRHIKILKDHVVMYSVPTDGLFRKELFVEVEPNKIGYQFEDRINVLNANNGIIENSYKVPENVRLKGFLFE